MTVVGADAPRALEGLRVVDMSGALGNYATKMFAELGADVVLVEPLEGNELRHHPPFVDGVESLDRSIPFFFHNTSKRSIRVDTQQQEGQEVVRRLASNSDLVVESDRPGEMGRRGLGFEDLRKINPRIVMTSITPFGQTGPYSQFQYADIVCMALGGLLWMGGYADGPPVRAVGDQSFMAANLFGAIASMAALTHAELTGEGQHIDVSVQEAVVMGLENAAQSYDMEGVIRRRFGGQQRQAGFGVFPCGDGHVFLLAGGIGGNRFWGNLIDWMREEGESNLEELSGPEWGEKEFLALASSKELFERRFVRFAESRTKEQLYRDAQRWRVPLCPINKPSDVLENSQLRSREFFVGLEAFGRTFDMPGAPYRMTGTPWKLSRPAPGPGEHTDEILREIDYEDVGIQTLRSKGVVA
jgi:benzylsuccinate CoA-transferase BbsE subunit